MGSILTGFIKFSILSTAQIGGVQQGHIFLGLLLQGTDFFIHRCWILSGASVQLRFRSSDLWVGVTYGAFLSRRAVQFQKE